MKNTEGNDEIDYREFEDYGMKSCSATDCTGLIPSLPQDEGEVEAYEDLYPYIAKAKNVAKTTKHNFSHRHQTE